MISTDFANPTEAATPEQSSETTTLPAPVTPPDEMEATPLVAAHAAPDGTLVTVTDSETDTVAKPVPIPTSEALAATAAPSGHVGIMVPPEGNADYVTRDELKELLDQAYLRGRNEAIRATIVADTTSRPLGQPSPAMASDVALLFAGRPSVWDEK